MKTVTAAACSIRPINAGHSRLWKWSDSTLISGAPTASPSQAAAVRVAAAVGEAPWACCTRGPHSTPTASIVPNDAPANSADQTTRELAMQDPSRERIPARRFAPGRRDWAPALVPAAPTGLRTITMNPTVSSTPNAPNPVSNCCQDTTLSSQEIPGWLMAEPTDAQVSTSANISPYLAAMNHFPPTYPAPDKPEGSPHREHHLSQYQGADVDGRGVQERTNSDQADRDRQQRAGAVPVEQRTGKAVSYTH